jgi:hypothetical protein
MPRGSYYIDAILMQGENRYLGCFHSRERTASFIVYDSMVPYFEGHIFMDVDIALNSVNKKTTYQRKLLPAASNHVRSLGRVNKPLTQFESILTLAGSMGDVFQDMEICLPIRVENCGREPWMASGRHPVALSYRWLARDGEVVVADGIRTRLPSDLSPGGTVVVPMRIGVPSGLRSLQLVISLLQENIAWFVDKNPNAAHVIPIELR